MCRVPVPATGRLARALRTLAAPQHLRHLRGLDTESRILAVLGNGPPSTSARRCASGGAPAVRRRRRGRPRARPSRSDGKLSSDSPLEKGAGTGESLDGPRRSRRKACLGAEASRTRRLIYSESARGFALFKNLSASEEHLDTRWPTSSCGSALLRRSVTACYAAPAEATRPRAAYAIPPTASWRRRQCACGRRRSYGACGVVPGRGPARFRPAVRCQAGHGFLGSARLCGRAAAPSRPVRLRGLRG